MDGCNRMIDVASGAGVQIIYSRMFSWKSLVVEYIRNVFTFFYP